MEIEPNFLEPHREISLLTKYEKNNEHLVKMEKLFENSNLNDDNKTIDEIKKETMLLHGPKKYLEACKYCNGRDYTTPKIEAAIQTKRPLPIPKY